MKTTKTNELFLIDYHAHVLPGCDHGSYHLATSLEQMKLAADAGVKIVCATPHFYPHDENVDTFLKRREKCCKRLRKHLEPGMPAVFQSAEVLMCEGIEHMENIEALCLESTNELLFEMPFTAWSQELLESVLDLQQNRKDIRFIMAHADRYPPQNVQIFIDEGVALQLNVESLANPFRNGRLKKWIEAGYVARIGSDIHQTDNTYRYWGKCKNIYEKHSR